MSFLCYNNRPGILSKRKTTWIPTETPKPTNFILAAVAEDLKTGRFNYVRTRLPPEPNGYLHIGHVKAFLIDYNTAKEFGGELVLRFDDTNPAKEETEFVEAIEEDCQWLGIRWVKVTFASDYFDRLYEWAIRLVKKGLAYVDDQTPEEMSASRGTLPRGTKWSQTESALKPGIESPLPEPFGRRKPRSAGTHEER